MVDTYPIEKFEVQHYSICLLPVFVLVSVQDHSREFLTGIYFCMDATISLLSSKWLLETDVTTTKRLYIHVKNYTRGYILLL